MTGRPGTGSSMSMNVVGTRVAVSSPYDTEDARGQLFPGSISVYEYNATTEEWDRVGDQFVGDQELEGVGFQARLNAAGDRLVASHLANEPKDPSGNWAPKVFALEDSSWIQSGDDILFPTGVDPTDFSAFNLAIDDAGEQVAFGFGVTENQNNRAGIAAVYRYTEKDWQLVGEPLLGPDSLSSLGRFIVLSGDGSTFAVSDRLDYSDQTVSALTASSER